MQEKGIFDIAIMGGGLAGLTAAIELGKRFNVLVVEKEKYPRHRVCGEYVSNEILSYLQSLEINPFKIGAKKINRFQISTHNGSIVESKLPLGGLGISRYALDTLLFERAQNVSTFIFENVTNVLFSEGVFNIETKEKSLFSAKYVIGAFGKRSVMDKVLNRKFIQQKSPWLAVKAHYHYPFDDDLVALHNFEGGYCGLSKVERGAVNACYLSTYKSFKKCEDIERFQKEVMSENPHLSDFFNKAKPIFENPLTISQISFDKKKPVENHVFMLGDAAGLIHPLCGNGMAMAIHSAKLLSDLFLKNGLKNRNLLEKEYSRLWNATFRKRLRMGRLLQSILLQPLLAKTSFNTVQLVPSLLPKIIKKTHGEIV